jgi:hypothetical protein
MEHVPLPFSTAELPQSTGNDFMMKSAHVIALCVNAAIFSKGDEDQWPQHDYGPSRVETWKMLVERFVNWYKQRSLDFQPIIELYPKDGTQSVDEFPIIIFTSGAALLSNQLYHTGMLLLLQNKPRFVDRPRSSSTTMSTLWHAHRICGISIQNDRVECWDPCLVASLIMAGRTATHGSQHEVISNTLENVQQLTGWNFSRCTDELRRDWMLANSC